MSKLYLSGTVADVTTTEDKSMLKYLLIFAIAAVVVVLGLRFTGEIQSTNEPTQLVSNVESSLVFAVGRVEGGTPEIQLRPQAAGPITHVPVAEGEFVEKDQVLLQIDDRPQRHAVALAAAVR